MPKGTRGRTPCSLPDCDDPVDGNGYCKFHNTRFKRTGDPLGVKPSGRPMRAALERIMDRTNKDGPIPERAPHLGPCWVCSLSPDPRGYSYASVGGNSGLKRPSHQIVYEELVGPIPEGLELDHLCMNPSCVNPSHLEPVTHAENMRRAAQAGRFVNQTKTHCPKDHPYEGDNLVINSKGRRECRECKRQRGLDWYYRNSDPARRTGRKR